MTNAKIHALEGGGVMWWCPACRCAHGGPGWSLTGPETVHPSLITEAAGARCHSTVVSGMIHFDADCTNGWAGRAVPLEPF